MFRSEAQNGSMGASENDPHAVADDLPPMRIFLSPPDVGETERKLLLDAFDSNWIAPLGPHVDAFEQDMADTLGGGVHAVTLSSGTAALHLALLDLGVGPGDEVVTSTMTFAATANAISYVGAAPVFVDVDPDTWQRDPALVEQAIRERAAKGQPPAAVNGLARPRVSTRQTHSTEGR